MAETGANGGFMASFMNNPNLSMGLQVAGMVSSTLGAYYSAQSQKDALEFQAEMSDFNARIYERAAQSELMKGQREEQNARLKTAHLKSAQRVALAANGVDLGVGSAANILTSTDVMGEIDANTIAANAVRSAWGYRTQATNASIDGIMKRSSASSISPGMAAATSLLGSATGVAKSWYGLNKQGAFDTPKDSSSSLPMSERGNPQGNGYFGGVW